MESKETKALLVRSVDYRENDRIVTLMTFDLGKIGAIAYGARRSKRRFQGALQPFQLIRVVLRTKRSRELYELVEAEVVECYRSIPGDSKRYACATYALELAREVTPADELDSQMADVLVRFLGLLDERGARLFVIAAALLNILEHAGFAPALGHCASCGKAAPPGKAGHFETSRGIVCTSCGGSGPVISGSVREAMIAATAWESRECSDKELSTAIRHLRGFAREHVGKELRSWPLLDRYLQVFSQPSRSSESGPLR